MTQTDIAYRSLGSSGLEVSSVAMGCWPIAGMTSLDVEKSQSLRTLESAANAGVNFFDTAYGYGKQGESECLIAEALGHRRGELVLATKGGLAWDRDGQRVLDGSPETLKQHCETSLRRLQTDHIDLYYLHAPDPSTPIEESASAIAGLIQSGKIRSAGVSNVALEQANRFHQVCPLTAIQPHYNMLQREIEADLLPWAQENHIALVTYWPLLKGLLAGRLPRDFTFRAGDGRAKYPMFQGEEWEKNQDFLDQLRELARDSQRSVAEIVTSWTIHQPGITAALCGAKRPYQIIESAQAMTFKLDRDEYERINQALKLRGTPKSSAAV